MQGYALTRPMTQSVSQGFPSLAGSSLNQPRGLDQLLLDAAQGDPYYSDSEDPSGVFTHMLADRSTQAGDLREKRLGHCLDFNGVDQAADLGVAYTNETKIAFAGWFKIPEGQAVNDTFFGNDTNTTGTRGWAARSYGGQVLELFISPDGGVTSYYRFRYTDVADGTWHHIAFLFDAGTVSFYLDGSLTAAAVTAPVGSPAGTINANGQNTFVGAKSGPATYGELTCYDIRQAEGDAADDLIAELATIISTPVTTTTSLLSHHWMQEESGPTIYDSSGNGNHGTISGYAASQRVTDAGVQYSVANEVGHCAAAAFNGVNSQLVASVSGLTNNGTGIVRFVFTDDDTSVLSFGNFSGYGICITCARTPGHVHVTLDSVGGFLSIARGGFQSGDIVEVAYNYNAATDTLSGTFNGLSPDGTEIGRHSATINNQLYIGSNDGTYFYSGHLFSAVLLDGNGDTWLNFNPKTLTDDSPNALTFTNTGVTTTLIPPLDSSTTQDALGGELTHKGRCPMYGLAKHVAWQGNGVDVYVSLADEVAHALADDFSFKARWHYKFSSAGGNNDDLLLYGTNINLRTDKDFSGQVRLQSSGTDINFTLAESVYDLEITKAGSSLSILIDGEVKGTVTVANEQITGLRLLNAVKNSAWHYAQLTTGGVTTTYVPIEGTRHVAKLTSDGSDTKIITSAVAGGSLATLYTQGDGSWRLPHIENGARWDGTSLIPCDPLGNSPDGNDRNILPGKLDREQGVRVDRTGGKLSPLDYELGLDELTNEHGEQWVENITGDW